jgi:hypothetical protein
VIRLHWKGAKGNRGYLDLTPEHLVRHVTGEYIAASELKGDLRPKGASPHTAKVRVLSANRAGDRLSFTGYADVLEHRFLYSHFIEPLIDKDVIHHKDGNHLNHSLSNLEKMDLSKHATIHVKDTLLSEKSRNNNTKVIQRGWKEGRYTVRRGKESFNYLGLTKRQCLRFLSKAGGCLTKVNIDFESFKKYLCEYRIDIELVKLRYDKNGGYISKGRLFQLAAAYGRSKVQKILGHNHYKLLRLYALYGVDSRRLWGNQFGSFTIGNHQITRIEWLDEEVDVYDIEVQDYHNFIANELCVHNSSSQPNFQNIPVRDPDIAKLIRRAFIPRPGHRFGGVDYAAIEVKIGACLHLDSVMLEYINDPSKDMHRDMAMECYVLRQDQVTKQSRYAAKNKFVFPQFYGDWYKSCAKALWEAIDSLSLQTVDGQPLRDHLKEQGIQSYQGFEKHIQKVEDRFWNERFRVYAKWKEGWVKQYEKTGKVYLPTGFTCCGVMERNQVINFPVQGAAFHCLLWSLSRLHRWMKEHNCRSKIVGQIHDEITMDNHPEEMGMVLRQAKQIMCEDIRKAWPWIVTPLEIEAEFAPVDRSWYEKESAAIE